MSNGKKTLASRSLHQPPRDNTQKMDYSNYRRRDYSKCDYSPKMPPGMDFDEVSEEVKKFGKVENITFYVTEGPGNPSKVKAFVNELRSHKINFLARTNRSNYNSDAFEGSDINLVDVTFTVPSFPPEEFSLHVFHGLIKNIFLENKKVAVAIQGYEDGAFLIVFALMVLGYDRVDALIKVREFEGEATISQIQYLRGREKDLKKDHEIMLTRRKPRGFFARCVYHVLNAHR
ncbi:unnamed protein product [Nezara viridula]|uniref:Uncharacterized protein n=1 Tax=Nezara viridula TaxID=85310 RepID=A0A9P0E6J7_NEZVI|nr:unnamed protein product [Nezara viridula]